MIRRSITRVAFARVSATAVSRTAVLATALLVLARGHVAAVEPPLAIDVLRYDATITPDVESRSLTGSVAVTFRARGAGFGEVSFDCGDLVVERVAEGAEMRTFVQRDRKVFVSLGRSLPVNTDTTLVVTYHGSPRRGLVFDRAQRQAYTIFSTSEWLVATSAPADKAALRLTLQVPSGTKVTASGQHTGDRPLGNGRVASEWVEDRPMPAYVFGFAVGEYTEVTVPWGARTLRHLGADVSGNDLRKALGRTAAALDFFERVSGVPYRFDTYTQVVSGTGVGQEVNRLAILPAAIVDFPASSLGVHEIAHQWWGNSVTCVDFRHLWLNEGMTTFMTAAFIEQAEGRAAYDRQIAASRARYERVKEAGRDKPLIFAEWSRATADDRTIVYHKGSYVLSLLRAELGDEAFWKGIRAYTQRYVDASVDTADFVREMETAAGRELTTFVRQWIDPSVRQ